MSKVTQLSCLKCNNPNFIEKLASFKIDTDPQNIFEVEAFTFECQNCKFQVMDNKQMNAFRKTINDYKKDKNVSK